MEYQGTQKRESLLNLRNTEISILSASQNTSEKDPGQQSDDKKGQEPFIERVNKHMLVNQFSFLPPEDYWISSA